MPFCQAPIKSNIFNNQKCGMKIIPNSDLHLCQFHYDLIKNTKPISNFNLPSSNICLLCMKQDGEFKKGFCTKCINADELNFNSLLELFIKKNIIKSCDVRVVELFKDYLGSFDKTLPRLFDIEINENTNFIEIKSENCYKKIYFDEQYNLIQRTYL